MLSLYAKTSLIIIENDMIGSINLDSYVPMNLYLESVDKLKLGEIPIDLLNPNELS